MIERFGSELIEKYLRDARLRYLVDEDGDFLVRFGGDDRTPDFRVQLTAEGTEHQLLCIRVSTAATFPDTLRGRVDEFVGRWNRTKRWPKTFTYDDPHGNGIGVIGENSYPLQDGVHRELLRTLIDTTIATGQELVTDLVEEMTRPSIDQLETWFRENN